MGNLQSNAALAGGYKNGDRVTALVSVNQIRTGDVGTIVGPCNNMCTDKVDEDRVLVDFGEGRGMANYLAKGLLPANVRSWDVQQVIAFFEQLNFPTAGVESNKVDGESLVNLYQDPDAESLFTDPAPEGLGFSNLMFKGRLKKEMQNLGFFRGEGNGEVWFCHRGGKRRRTMNDENSLEFQQ